MPSTSSSSSPPSRPASFKTLVAVIDKAMRGMDQKLGYPGKDRFVLFYYEPRGEEVIWRDSHSYGFATGAWPVFKEELAPIADLYHVHVGNDGTSGEHVLLVDRVDRRAYFVLRDEAVRFLQAVADGREASLLSAAGGVEAVPTMPASVEVTQESVAKLAYEIWERKGRVEGHYLDDWLEAERN